MGVIPASGLPRFYWRFAAGGAPSPRKARLQVSPSREALPRYPTLTVPGGGLFAAGEAIAGPTFDEGGVGLTAPPLFFLGDGLRQILAGRGPGREAGPAGPPGLDSLSDCLLSLGVS